LEADAKATLRASAIAGGKLAPEEFEHGFAATPKAFYKALVADAQTCLEVLQTLDDRSREKFGDVAPNYAKLRGAIEESLRISKQLLKRKLEVDPDPVEASTTVDVDDAAALVGRVLDAAAGAPASVSAQPSSRDDASTRIAGAARWLRANHPQDPAAYLLLRGFRWGEVRAGGPTPNPRLLAAPTTETRTKLKSLLLDAKWADLLEQCETVMGMAQGRGWLDLQRYMLTACDALGAEYHYVAGAVRSALRSLLADVPTLPEMTMMDDTPTANAETRAWLRDHGLIGAPLADGVSSEQDMMGVREPGAVAAAEVRAGRHDRAITLLMQDIAREKTHRGRFMLQTQLSRTMVDAGHHAVALPMLEELVRHIDEHKLEEWESGDIVAQPLALLFRCLEHTGDEGGQRQALYLRICRLDPLAAIGFATAASDG
jgi:type VI secretion system protein ImpA